MNHDVANGHHLFLQPAGMNQPNSAELVAWAE